MRRDDEPRMCEAYAARMQVASPTLKSLMTEVPCVFDGDGGGHAPHTPQKQKPPDEAGGGAARGPSLERAKRNVCHFPRRSDCVSVGCLQGRQLQIRASAGAQPICFIYAPKPGHAPFKMRATKSSMRCVTVSGMVMVRPHSRLVSPGHLLVASSPILPPRPLMGEAKSR